MIRCFAVALLFALFSFCAVAQSPDPHSVPSIDAALGPCSADFLVNDADGHPVYLAKISTRVAYGFGSFHKLDLEISTNVDGKARFTGFPATLKHGLYFQATDSQNRTAVAFDDPEKTCEKQFTLTLQPPPK